MKRYLIIFEGRVQGVGFRFFTAQTASRLGLTGFVRNLANGNVEMEIQGEDDAFSAFLGTIMKGTGFIKVSDYAMKEMPLKENEKSFRVTG